MKDLEKRVEVLEKVVAKGVFGGTDEEAMEKWNAEYHAPKVEDHPPPIPSPAAPATKADHTLHKTQANTKK